MLSIVYAAGLAGVDGFLVTVECSSAERIPQFELVGLPDAAVREAKERVRAAVENSGIHFPDTALTLNLAPADRRKEGAAFDLAIMTAVLRCGGEFPAEYPIDRACMIGELSLSGEVRPVRGVLCMCLAARAAGKTEIFVPEANAAEAAAVEGVNVYGVRNVRQLLAHLSGKVQIPPSRADRAAFEAASAAFPLDFADVKGQFMAKRAME
ncbi:MAG: ATP-binding protein, partial [Clostridia bacterium]|nr:ATP-binding protein [Clostridia bacterium]